MKHFFRNKYLLKLALPIVIVLVAISATTPLFAQNKEEFENLIFYVPQGLQINKTNNSVILTDPSVAAGESFSITINRSTFSLKKIEKSFPVFWKESLAADGFDSPTDEPSFVKYTNNAGWDCFRGGKLVSYTAQSAPQYYHLTIIKYLGITARIITKASSEDLFLRKLPLLMQLIASIDLKKQQQQNTNARSQSGTYSGNPSGQSGNNTPSNTSVQVQSYALYMSVQGDLLSNAEISVLYFMPDGTVYIDIPEKGFSQFNAQEQKAKTPATFGTYSSSGSNIIVKMNGDPNGVSYAMKQDGTLQPLNNPALVYRKLETLNNYRLEGNYAKKDDTGVTISFTRDGRFTDNGLIKNLVPSNPNNQPGNGSYSITQNSILLQYSDGRSVQLAMYMMPEDYQQGSSPNKLLINNYVLLRQ